MNRVLLLLVGCGECTWCAGRASITHEEDDRTVVVEAQGFRDIGMGAFGAPHAFGIIYPEFQGSGYRISLTVDDRPVVDVAREGTGETPSDEALEAILGAIEVRVSSAGDHVALRFHERWHVFHLLEAGTPFVLPGSLVEGELDLDSMPSARESALAFLADETAEHDRQELLWLALAAVPGEPWDSAVLGPWPASDEAAEHVTARLSGQPPTSEEWRAALDREARVKAAEPPGEGELARVQERSIDALVALGGESLGWLDRHMLARWSDLAAPGRGRARAYLSGRARLGTEEPIGTDRLDGALLPELARASRVVLEALRPSARADRRYERREGVWVVGVESNDEFFAVRADQELALLALEVLGNDADHAYADEVVFAEWPAADWTSFDDAVKRRIAAAPGDEALRARVLAKARPALEDSADLRDVAEVLFAFRHPETDDVALRALLRRFDQIHWFTMQPYVGRASPEFERDAVAEAERIVEEAKPFEEATDAERFRAGYAIELIFALKSDAPCNELNAYVELYRSARTVNVPELPQRCLPPPPSR